MIRKGSKNKFDMHNTYEDIYKHYKVTSDKPVDKAVHAVVLADTFETLMGMVIKDGFLLQFPHKFGSIEIQKKKQQIIYNEDGSINRIAYKIDWGETKKHWQTVYGDIPYDALKQIKNKPKIYCKNKYRMKFKYIKDKAVYKGKSAVMFIPSRKWCRELATHLKTDPYRTDYKEQ
jgi:hypothetical protein